MAGCDDTRQLTEQQRQDGYQNQRTGVPQAVRPFTGRPTIDNLIDYINRELQPAVRQTRSAVNDIYLQATDNAPSGNPLTYYFSSSIVNADPTAGFIRLNSATQSAATTIRVSELNARLQDAVPWLEVMAGGATVPLGVVTLTDAINPARFVRFDLESMVDQGAYWDLTVTPIEASSDTPFVDGGGIAVAFIPGVASDGATVPPGSVTPMGPYTVLGNPTGATVAPVEIGPFGTNTVLGRKSGDIVAEQVATAQIENNAVTDAKLRQSSGYGVIGRETNSAGNVADIVPPTTFPGFALFLRTNSTQTAIAWRPLTFAEFPPIADNRFVGNLSGATAVPIAWDFAELNSDTIIYENTNKSFIREALVGDVTAPQNSNTTTIANDAVTDAKLRDSGALSVIGRAVNAAGDPADIPAVAGSDAVFRESGSTIGFGTIATGGLADDSVTNAKLANMAANTVKGNATASTADPQDIAVGTNTVLGRAAGNIVAAQVATGQIADDAVTNAKLRDSGALSVIGRSTNSIGDPADIIAASDNQVLRRSGSAIGFGTIATGGLADDAVTNAKLANMAANTIKANPTASAADPQDLAISADSLPARVGGNLVSHPFSTLAGTALTYAAGEINWDGITVLANGAGPVAWLAFDFDDTATVDFAFADNGAGQLNISANVPDDAVTNAKLRNSAALSVIGRSANSTGDPADIAAANDGEVLRRSGATLGFGTVASAGIADNAVTDAKLRDSAALSVIGRAGNTSGDPADIAAGANDRLLARTSDTLAFQQLTNGMVPTNTVGIDKLANQAAGTLLGRAIDAGTGAVTALTGLQQGQNLRLDTLVTDSSASGTASPYSVATQVNWVRFSALTGTYTVNGCDNVESGKIIVWHVEPGVTGSLVLAHNNGALTNNQRFFCPGAVDLTLRSGETAVTVQTTNRHRVLAVSRLNAFTDGDKGDVTVSSGGTVWTIDNDVVSDAKLRNSVALSVIGRSANTTGDPADIAAANDGEVLRRSGTTLGFGTVATAGLADDSATNAKLANMAANTIKANPTASTADPQDLAISADSLPARVGGNLVSHPFSTLAGTALTYAAGAINWDGITVLANGVGPVAWLAFDFDDTATVDWTFANNGSGQLNVSADVPNDAITNAKLRNSGACSVIGRSANSTGDPADISAATNNRVFVRRSDALSFEQIVNDDIAAGTIALGKIAGITANTVIGNNTGSTTNPVEISVGANTVLGRVAGNIVAAQVATGQIADAAVTLAKMANLAQSRIVGRAEGAGTGVPTALTPTEVVSIIDGESPTWAGSHTFNGTLFDVNTSSNVTIASGSTLTLAASSAIAAASPFLAQGSLSLTGVISPTLSADANDWNPTGFGSATIVRVNTTTATRTVTGMLAPSATYAGRLVILINVGDQLLILPNESGSSTAANRFLHAYDSPTLTVNDCAVCWYDQTSTRWRIISGSFPGG